MKKNTYSVSLTTAIVLLSACGASVDPGLHGDAAASISPLLDFATGSAEPGQSYAELREGAIADCMHAKGWQYEAIVLGTEGLHESNDPSTMLHYREQYGYGLLNNTGVAHQTRAAIARRRAYLEALPNDARARFAQDLGANSDDNVEEPSGCRGQAEAASHARYPATRPEVLQALGQAHETIVHSPEYTAAVERWSACMQGRGFDYHSVDDGRAEVSALLMAGNRGQEAQARERAVGAADAQCSQQTLWPVQTRLERAALHEVISSHGL